MKTINPPLLLFIISGILYFLSIVIDNEYLILISKPIIFTSIFFYYLQESNGKIKFLFAAVLLLLSLSGILILFEDDVTLRYVMLINILAYSILLGFVANSLYNINFKLLDNINLIYIFLMLIFLSCLLYLCLFVVFDATSVLYLYYVVYGSVLLILGFLITVLYVLNNSKDIVYLMIATFCFIICDLFHAIYFYYYELVFFRYTSVLCNILSFYFLVHYFLLKNKNV